VISPADSASMTSAAHPSTLPRAKRRSASRQEQPLLEEAAGLVLGALVAPVLPPELAMAVLAPPVPPALATPPVAWLPPVAVAPPVPVVPPEPATPPVLTASALRRSTAASLRAFAASLVATALSALGLSGAPPSMGTPVFVVA